MCATLWTIPATYEPFFSISIIKKIKLHHPFDPAAHPLEDFWKELLVSLILSHFSPPSLSLGIINNPVLQAPVFSSGYPNKKSVKQVLWFTGHHKQPCLQAPLEYSNSLLFCTIIFFWDKDTLIPTLLHVFLFFDIIYIILAFFAGCEARGITSLESQVLSIVAYGIYSVQSCDNEGYMLCDMCEVTSTECCILLTI